MPQQGNSWVVEGGENVFSIAQKVFGNQRMAMEILRMNGGQTVIHPGDTLVLPEWNDPDLYIGANEFQRVLTQNAQNPNYKGPTVAAVPDSQRLPAVGGTPPPTPPGYGSDGETAIQGPNIPNIGMSGGIPGINQRGEYGKDYRPPVGSTTFNAGPTQWWQRQQATTTPATPVSMMGGPAGQRTRDQKPGNRPQQTVPGMPATQQTQAGPETSFMNLAGGNIGRSIAATTEKNMNTEMAKKLANPLYSPLADKLIQSGALSPTSSSSSSGTTGTNKSLNYAAEAQKLNQAFFAAAYGAKPPDWVPDAVAIAALGANYAQQMKAFGYIYDNKARRWQYSGPTTTASTGGPPTSYQQFGEDYNQSHYPGVWDAGGGGAGGGGGYVNGGGGGVTGRAASTVGNFALNVRIATG